MLNENESLIKQERKDTLVIEGKEFNVSHPNFHETSDILDKST